MTLARKNLNKFERKKKHKEYVLHGEENEITHGMKNSVILIIIIYAYM